MSFASHRPLRLVISVVLRLVLAVGLGRAGLAVGAPVRPPTPPDLPVEIENPAAYVPQVSCDPRTKPGAARLAG